MTAKKPGSTYLIGRIKETTARCGRCLQWMEHSMFAKIGNKPAGWCKNCVRERYLEKTYGISLKEYDDLIQKQQGVCAICEESPDHNLYVDHDHLTGHVRGLLCRNCNTGIGYFGDSLSKLHAAGIYLYNA